MVADARRADGVHLRQGAPDVLGRFTRVQTNLLVREEGGEATQFADGGRTRGAGAQTRPFKYQRHTLTRECRVVEWSESQPVDPRQIVITDLFDGGEMAGHATTSVVGI